LPGLPASSQLVILGAGRLEQDLKALARELGIGDRVLFLGQVPEARRYFRAFDVFALSSDHEPFGMVLLEAMAAGVPLLATACGGAKEVVEGVGILFPLGDAEHLAQGLQHLAAMDEQQRHQCAELMLDRLRERFSDRAVRDAFWRLPHVTELAPRG
jgi:glycosyltransferase involved in cell wall biosynthesis